MKSALILCTLMLSLCGCGGSSNSNSGSATLTSGTTYASSGPVVVTTIAGTPGLSGSKDGTGSVALFGQPNGVIVSPDGTTLYVTDYGNNTIRQIALSSGAVTTLAGGTGLSGAVDATGAAARFNGPNFLATDGSNLYVTDWSNNSVRKVVIATGAVSTLAGSTAGASGNTDGAGTVARFSGPTGITITSDLTTLYVSDYWNNSIRKIVIATGAVSTVATSSLFNNPAGITQNGIDLYVTDFNANLIRQLDTTSGALTTLAGSSSYYGSKDGIGSAASFNYPNGITILGGNLYVADSANDIIRQVNIATGVVATVAGVVGTAGSENGTYGSVLFNNPLGITNDGTNLYVADSQNKTIRKIQPLTVN